MMDKHVYALVLAGGQGTRLWPASRHTHPKQFCRIAGDKTLLEVTLARLEGFIPVAQRLVVTPQAQYEKTAELLRLGSSDALAGEIVVEPEARGTLAAVGLATLSLAARDPQAVVISLHVDAAIKDVAAWQSALTTAVDTARHDYLVLLGAKPYYAATNYDYIARGEAIAGQAELYRAQFHYRPSVAQAQKFLQAGSYFWNSGIFTWRAVFFQQELQAAQPQVADLLAACVSAKGKINRTTLRQNYPQLPELSVDGGILPQCDSCVMLPLDCGWLDIGSWEALAQAFATDKDGNLAFGQVLLRDCQGTTVTTRGLQVAALGVKDIIIVVTADAVLVCDKHRAQEVRELVACLPDDVV